MDEKIKSAVSEQETNLMNGIDKTKEKLEKEIE